MINLPTKFEVPSFTRYGDMNGVAKYTKWGGLGWLGSHPRPFTMSPFDRSYIISYESSIVSRPVSLSCTVFETITLICQSFKRSCHIDHAHLEEVCHLKANTSLGQPMHKI